MIRIFVLSFLIFISVTTLQAQNVSALIRNAELAEQIPNESLALERFKQVLNTDADNIYALSKCSELSSRIGSRMTTEKSQDAWFAAAVVFANKALKYAPYDDKANVAKAIALGKSSMNKSGKEKVKNAVEIKRHIDVALKDNPNNYLAYHVLGRWNYEIGMVSSFERAAAKVFYGKLPDGSVNNAIVYFEKAKSLAPAFVLNYYELAKAYKENNQELKAKEALHYLQRLPSVTEDDENIKAMARRLLSKLS